MFFEFAGPLLLTARDEQEFQAASRIADFIWTATFLDAESQAQMIDLFIEDVAMPNEMIDWFFEVYEELAARKQALLGE